MTPSELLVQCEQQLALHGAAAEISLVLPGSYGSDTKRLCPGGPLGRVAQEQHPQSVQVFFSAQEVKMFLEAFTSLYPLAALPVSAVLTYSPTTPLRAAPPKHGPLRATLRRLVGALVEVLTPGLPEGGRGLVGAYRDSTAPVNAVHLLDYIDELLLEREQARAFYIQHVQALLLAWKSERRSHTDSPFFDLKCRELTGLGLYEKAPSAPGSTPLPSVPSPE